VSTGILKTSQLAVVERLSAASVGTPLVKQRLPGTPVDDNLHRGPFIAAVAIEQANRRKAKNTTVAGSAGNPKMPLKGGASYRRSA